VGKVEVPSQAVTSSALPVNDEQCDRVGAFQFLSFSSRSPDADEFKNLTGIFPVQRYILGEIFMKIPSVVFFT